MEQFRKNKNEGEKNAEKENKNKTKQKLNQLNKYAPLPHQMKSSNEPTNKPHGMDKMRTVNVRRKERRSQCLKENRESLVAVFVLGHSF